MHCSSTLYAPCAKNSLILELYPRIIMFVSCIGRNSACNHRFWHLNVSGPFNGALTPGNSIGDKKQAC